MKRPLPWMICAAVLAVVGGPCPVFARPTKIALTKIDGDASGLGKAVIEALDDSELAVVSAKQVGRTSDLLGLDDTLSDRDVEKLAARLEVDAIVKGTFDRRAHKLRFTIFANGKKGKSFHIKVDDADSDQFRKQVRTKLVTRLAVAVAPDSEVAKEDSAASDDATPKKAARSKAKGKVKDTDEAADAVADDSAKKPVKGKAKGKAKAKDADEAADAVADDSAKKPAKAKAKGKDADEATDAVADDSAKKPAKAKGKGKDADEAADAVADDSAKKPAKAKAKAKGKGKDADEAADVVAEDSPKKAAKARTKETEEATAAAPSAEEASAPATEGEAPRAAAKQVAVRDEEALTPRTHARVAPSSRGDVHSANLVAVRADVGTSMSARELRFKTTTFANAPRPYQNAPVPGARFEGELYPFAFHDPTSALAGLGVAADFDQTVALTLHASAEMTVPLKATERHYSVGLRYRIAFGHTPTSPTLTLGGGYGVRMFAVNRTGLMSSASFELPDVHYKLFDPGLAFRLPLGTTLAITLGGRALLVTAAGQIQHADQYGNAKILGGSGSAGLELIFGDRVALRIAGEATQLTYKFDGTGMLTTTRDGNAATLDVRGATDRYYGGAATLAILY